RPRRGLLTRCRSSASPDRLKLGVRNRREISCCRFPHSRDGLDRRRGTPPGTRPKGWQVSWLAGQCSLPPSRPVASRQTSVASGKRSPLTVAGAAVGLYRSARALDPYHIPSSLSRSREAITA